MLSYLENKPSSKTGDGTSTIVRSPYNKVASKDKGNKLSHHGILIEVEVKHSHTEAMSTHKPVLISLRSACHSFLMVVHKVTVSLCPVTVHPVQTREEAYIDREEEEFEHERTSV